MFWQSHLRVDAGDPRETGTGEYSSIHDSRLDVLVAMELFAFAERLIQASVVVDVVDEWTDRKYQQDCASQKEPTQSQIAAFERHPNQFSCNFVKIVYVSDKFQKSKVPVQIGRKLENRISETIH